MKSTLPFLFRVAIAPLVLCLCLAMACPLAQANSLAAGPLSDTTASGLGTVAMFTGDDDAPLTVAEPTTTVEAIEAAVVQANDPEADLSDIFSPIAKAMTTTETVLQTDATETSIFEALADVNEAADEQALNAQPQTLEGSLQNWFTSVKTFLDLE
ncbi:MAG: hypothetical protein AAFU71_17625 [Cyanobacteria bacterium J06632_22]